MATAKKEGIVKIHLWLSEEEAKDLRDLLQNPVTVAENSHPELKSIRRNVFEALRTILS